MIVFVSVTRAHISIHGTKNMAGNWNSTGLTCHAESVVFRRTYRWISIDLHSLAAQACFGSQIGHADKNWAGHALLPLISSLAAPLDCCLKLTPPLRSFRFYVTVLLFFPVSGALPLKLD